MQVFGINNSYTPSFCGKKEKSHRLPKSAYIVPALLLMSTPQMPSTAQSDSFEIQRDSVTYNMPDSCLLASNLNLDMQDETIARAIIGKTIVLDPGHGGTYKTKTSPSDPYGAKFYDYKEKKWHYEKDLTLDISKKVEKYLKEFGANVIATRDSDEYADLEKRAVFAKDNNADLFVSIHVNSNTSKKPHGTTVHALPSAQKGNKETNDLADIMNNRVATVYDYPKEDIWRNNFKVLVQTKDIPGVLVETGYLSNPKDRELLLNEEHRDKTAKAIAAGIIEYFVQKAPQTEILFATEADATSN